MRDSKGRFLGLTLVGDWKAAKQVLADAPADLEQATNAALAAIAEFLVGRIKKRIGDGVAPPQSPFTALTKGSSKTLVNKGDFRNGMRAIEVGKFNFFVGIPSALQGGKNGHKVGSLARLGDVLENGRVIVQRMTDKQRKFLHATLGKKVAKLPSKGGSTGVLVIHIPPRPVIKPTFDEFQADAPRLFEKYLKKNLKRIGT